MKNIVLSVITGILISLSFPGVFIPFAFLGGFLIFLFMIKKEKSLKNAFFFSLITGISFSLFSFYWIVFAITHYGDVNIFVGIILFVIFSITFSLFQFVPFGLFFFKFKSYPVLLPFVWVILEILREFFPFTGFPWNLMGYTLSYINQIAQITSVGGIYSLSFLALCTAVSVYLFLERKNIISTFYVIGMMIIFLILYVWGDHRIKNWEKKGVPKNVAVIQGNIKEDIKQSPNERLMILQTYIDLIKEASKHNVDLIILPESALPVYPLYQEPDVYRDYLFDQLKKIKKPVLSGFDNVYYKDHKLILHNSIFIIDKNGNILDHYSKIKLVPFGEYVPFPFGAFKPLFPYLQGYDFMPGRDKKLLEFNQFKIVPLICYEVIFPVFVADFSKHGNIIVNVTNDAWFGKTVAPFQHFEMARVRAIENGKYLVRAANTGISAVINPVGEIDYSLGLFEKGIILDTVYLNDSLTFWNRYHHIILISFVLLFIIIFISALIKKS